jgi:hypothetical protein
MSIAERSGMRRAEAAVTRELAVVPPRLGRDGAESRWSKGAAAAAPALRDG